MKNRKIVVVAFLLIAMLLLGVGYAALTDDLFITGTAQVKLENADAAFSEDIYFSKAVMSADKGTATIGADDNGDANDKITITVAEDALAGQGSSVICAIEIKNAGDLDAWVTLNPTFLVSNGTYFAVSTSWANNTQKIVAGGTADITVTITCIKTPQATVNTTFGLDFSVSDVDPNA